MNIAPSKANWDLRRDVAAKLVQLERRTQAGPNVYIVASFFAVPYLTGLTGQRASARCRLQW